MEHLEFRLKYGLDKNTRKSRFINEVEKGLPCNCICPICEQELVAKKGNVRVHHFAHHNGADECKGARMSMLHRLAQEVIQEDCKVLLPAYKGKYIQHNAKLQVFDEVTLEQLCVDEVSRRRPDCIGKIQNEGIEIWVEIFCTNPINEERRKDIIRLKQYCIEIDLSDLLGSEYTKESVRERLLNKSDDRKWICHPIWDKEEDDREEANRKKIEEEKRKIAEALLKGELKTIPVGQPQKQFPQFIGTEKKSQEFWHIEPKEKNIHSVQEQPIQQDWLQDVKYIQLNAEGREGFYKMIKRDYAKVTFANSHKFVIEHAYEKMDQLMKVINSNPDLLQPETKVYLDYLLVLWVLENLNKRGEYELGKCFVEDQTLRNIILQAIKQIGRVNINLSEQKINDLHMLAKENTAVQILKYCYTN